MDSVYTILDPRDAGRHATRGRCALAVMAKAPLAGAVKTRLMPHLSPEEAARLSVCFLRDTMANIARVGSRTEMKADAVVAYTPAGAEAAFDGLLPEGCKLLRQRGELFGDRLFNAAADLLAAGYASLCLINSDSPTLPPVALASAVGALARPGDRVVLGPAEDGGYYLIGIKSPHRRLFDDVEWSTSRVLAQTLERAAELRLEVELLPAWYDIDEIDTLRRLCRELFSANNGGDAALVPYEAPHTRAHLDRLLQTGRSAALMHEDPASAEAAS